MQRGVGAPCAHAAMSGTGEVNGSARVRRPSSRAPRLDYRAVANGVAVLPAEEDAGEQLRLWKQTVREHRHSVAAAATARGGAAVPRDQSHAAAPRRRAAAVAALASWRKPPKQVAQRAAASPAASKSGRVKSGDAAVRRGRSPAVVSGAKRAATKGKAAIAKGKAAAAMGKAAVGNGKSPAAKGKAAAPKGKAAAVKGKTAAVKGKATRAKGTKGSNGKTDSRGKGTKGKTATKAVHRSHQRQPAPSRKKKQKSSTPPARASAAATATATAAAPTSSRPGKLPCTVCCVLCACVDEASHARGVAVSPPAVSKWTRYRKRVAAQLREARFNALLIDTYTSEGWAGFHGTGGPQQANRKVMPTAHVQEAETALRRIRGRLRAIVLELAKEDTHLPKLAYSDAGVLLDDIVCSVCRDTGNDAPDNDTLLCDYIGCSRAYHQLCLTPPQAGTVSLSNDDEWFCPAHDTLLDCLEMINIEFGTAFVSPETVFPDTRCAPVGSRVVLSPGG